jgi:hypothetical protein
MRCRCRFPSIFVLMAPWLTSAASAQVSRSAQVVAPSAAANAATSSVGTAALLGLEQTARDQGVC